MQITNAFASTALAGNQKTQQVTDTGFLSTPKEQSAARKAFLDYAQKTPAEQMREQILGSMGLKEEDLKNMDADKRAALERKIEEIIKHKVEQEQAKKGAVVDIKA